MQYLFVKGLKHEFPKLQTSGEEYGGTMKMELGTSQYRFSEVLTVFVVRCAGTLA
jgi:hypothetical protein